MEIYDDIDKLLAFMRELPNSNWESNDDEMRRIIAWRSKSLDVGIKLAKLRTQLPYVDSTVSKYLSSVEGREKLARACNRYPSNYVGRYGKSPYYVRDMSNPNFGKFGTVVFCVSGMLVLKSYIRNWNPYEDDSDAEQEKYLKIFYSHANSQLLDRKNYLVVPESHIAPAKLCRNFVGQIYYGVQDHVAQCEVAAEKFV